jgi:hypothetical protein
MIKNGSVGIAVFEVNFESNFVDFVIDLYNEVQLD